MAATAQDASAPLRGPEKKDEDRDEEGAALARPKILRERRPRSAHLIMSGRCRCASEVVCAAWPPPRPFGARQAAQRHCPQSAASVITSSRSPCTQRWSTRRSTVSRRGPSYRRLACSTTASLMPGGVSRCLLTLHASHNNTVRCVNRLMNRPLLCTYSLYLRLDSLRPHKMKLAARPCTKAWG